MRQSHRIVSLWHLGLTSRKLTIRGDGQYRRGHRYMQAARCKQVDDECFRHLDVQATSPSLGLSWRKIKYAL